MNETTTTTTTRRPVPIPAVVLSRLRLLAASPW